MAVIRAPSSSSASSKAVHHQKPLLIFLIVIASLLWYPVNASLTNTIVSNGGSLSSIPSSIPSSSSCSTGYINHGTNGRCNNRQQRRSSSFSLTTTTTDRRAFEIRGGGSTGSEDQYDDDTSDDNNDNTHSASTTDSNNNPTFTILSLFGKVVLHVIFAGRRAMTAGIDAIAEEYEEEDSSIVVRVGKVLKSMVLAAFQSQQQDGGTNIDIEDGGDGGGMATVTHNTNNKSVKRTANPSGKGAFGNYLCKSYGVPLPEPTTDDDDDDTDEDDTYTTTTPTVILEGGSLADALHTARSQGRLLVAFIPATKPTSTRRRTTSKKTTKIYDQMAIESLVSNEVAEVAERRARKKGDEGASFVLWGARSGSAEAGVAMKKLKVKKSDGKSPVLLVAYPSRTIDSYGRQTLTPRVVAQHHCNPPPSPSTTAAWLNALRKRHVKQYANMQLELRELALLQERTQGYQSSIQGDKEREATERREKKRLEEVERLEEAEMDKQRKYGELMHEKNRLLLRINSQGKKKNPSPS